MRIGSTLVLMIALTAPSIAHAPAMGAIDGTVRDAATQAPIPDAVVTATSPREKQSIRTDQAGRFFFIGLQYESYTIMVSRQGC